MKLVSIGSIRLSDSFDFLPSDNSFISAKITNYVLFVQSVKEIRASEDAIRETLNGYFDINTLSSASEPGKDQENTVVEYEDKANIDLLPEEKELIKKIVDNVQIIRTSSVLKEGRDAVWLTLRKALMQTKA